MGTIEERHDVYLWDFHNMKLVNQQDYTNLGVTNRHKWDTVSCEMAKIIKLGNSNIDYVDAFQKKRIDEHFENECNVMTYVQAVDYIAALDKGII